VGKDVARNLLVVDQGHDSPYLQSTALRASDATWTSDAAPGDEFECRAQTRYRQRDQACRVRVLGDGRLDAVFDEPQRAVTPGQSVVFYRDDECLGGAVIDATDAPLDALSRSAA
jgi:tRNA-specific 2-thiouridylase